MVVQIDKSKPSITGAPTTSPNAAGWYQNPVTVHFACADQPGLSGIASCTPDQTVATSGANQSVTGLASDNAGNTASHTVSGLKVDLVAPTVVVGGVIDGGIYPLGAVPTPSCASVDLLSGGGTCSGTVSGGNANGVGTFTYTATGTDRAGNTTTRVVKYRVVYVFSGFDEPINGPAHQIFWRTSVFKAGSTVPVKFDLHRADGTRVQPVTAPQWLAPVKIASLSALIDEVFNNEPATTGDTYRRPAAAGSTTGRRRASRPGTSTGSASASTTARRTRCTSDSGSGRPVIRCVSCACHTARSSTPPSSGMVRGRAADRGRR